MSQDPESLRDAITRLLEVYGLKNKLKGVELESSWAEIVGPMIAKYTQEVKLKNQTLIVKFNSAPLKQEVIMMKSKFIKRLNEELGGEYVKEMLVL